ncbi:MAG: DUF2092 domain-containing protein [Hyphomicrobiaceae bacterium]
MHSTFQKSDKLYFVTNFRVVDRAIGRTQNGLVRYQVKAPNLLRATATIDGKVVTVVSDGETLTIHEPQKRSYREHSARKSVVGNLYLASGLLGLQARLIDFLWSVEYLAVGGGTGWVSKLASRQFSGRTCDGFKVARGDDTWSVWLDRSDERRPCYVVSSRLDGSALVTQMNTLTWKPTKDISAGTFHFTAPKGHQRE